MAEDSDRGEEFCSPTRSRGKSANEPPAYLSESMYGVIWKTCSRRWTPAYERVVGAPDRKPAASRLRFALVDREETEGALAHSPEADRRAPKEGRRRTSAEARRQSVATCSPPVGRGPPPLGLLLVRFL